MLKELYGHVQDVCDKGTDHSYIDAYEIMFRPYQYSAKAILEVGVWQGGSLRMWEEYFSQAAIVGVDAGFDKNWGVAPLPRSWSKRVEIIRGDSTDPNLVSRLSPFGLFDIIIDDGSHLVVDQVTTFKNLFPLLSDGGIYIIEDVGSLVPGEPEVEVENAIESLRALDVSACVIDLRATKGKYNDVLIVFYKSSNTNSNGDRSDWVAFCGPVEPSDVKKA